MLISSHVIPLCFFLHLKNSESNTVFGKSQNTLWRNNNFSRKLFKALLMPWLEIINVKKKRIIFTYSKLTFMFSLMLKKKNKIRREMLFIF